VVANGKRRLVSIILAAFWLAALPASAHESAISDPEKSETVEALAAALKKHYVFPEKTVAISAGLRARLRAGEYKAIKAKDEFAGRLTRDLIDISGDLHFFVGVDPEWIADNKAESNPARRNARQTAELQQARLANYGFDKVSLLDGNIGYVSFTYFEDPEYGSETAAAAMRFIENADAVIFDLRYNNGGHLEMAQFLASYLFSHDKEQQFFDYYYVENGKRIARGQWLLPTVPGKRMPDTPVYILTGSTTFSAAEWFSFTLQKLGRAVLIGERTAGGAHPVDRKPINDDFFLQTPIGEIKDPVDHGDFEGKGVNPDYETAARDALAFAHGLALQKLAVKDPRKRQEYDWLVPALAVEATPFSISPADLQKTIGQYDGREIALEGGTLVYRWRGRFRLALEPLSPTLFAVEGVRNYRLQLVTENGRVTGLERIEQSGQKISYAKTD
jgi:hypothetical protein